MSNKDRNLPIIANTNFRSLLVNSARDLVELRAALLKSGLNMSKIDRFNERLCEQADFMDMSPEEVILSLELLAKYMILHSNWTGGKHGTVAMLLGFDPQKLAREGKNV